ncbi:7044_t:CDS:2 [Cetraspora pellucida]|uniref:7044_t:CDS:1 n=1 Tax=Cetraspora pellucida TaxID=1433469 RepID=A0ACA9MZ95_9GLOM|nr:7044_t:CDS:2 [Cetraspora pellucida]
MPQNNISINIHTLNSLLDARSTVHDVINKQFLRGISLSCQPKEKAEEIIKEFNEVNSTFPVSEANFVLHDWLTSYFDQEKKKRVTEAKMKGYALSPKKRNVQSSNRKYNMNYVDVERTSIQSDTDKTYDNAQDSFFNNIESADMIFDQDDTDENASDSDSLTTDPSQDNTKTTDSTFSQDYTTLVNKMPKKEN